MIWRVANWEACTDKGVELAEPLIKEMGSSEMALRGRLQQL